MVSERSAIVLPPSSQEVRNGTGDTAMFQCNAKGTNVSVTWRIDGSTCGTENCDLNGTTTYEVIEDDVQINATLVIRTDVLFLMRFQTVYNLQCVVEQNLESSSLIGSNLVFNVNLTVFHQKEVTTLGMYKVVHVSH